MYGMYLLKGRYTFVIMREELKVFCVNEFHFCYKETMEGVCRKSVTQLLQREWEWECHKGFSYLFQGVGIWKIFVTREFHICYMKRIME